MHSYQLRHLQLTRATNETNKNIKLKFETFHILLVFLNTSLFQLLINRFQVVIFALEILKNQNPTVKWMRYPVIRSGHINPAYVKSSSFGAFRLFVTISFDVPSKTLLLEHLTAMSKCSS